MGISKETVDQPTLELPQASTQDGGNCSDTKITWLSMIKERSSKYKEELMLRTETSLWQTKMARHNKDGKSFMLMSIKTSQLRDNSTRSSDFTLRETSTLCLNCHHTDTLT